VTERAIVKISAVHVPTQVMIEPIGNNFDLAPGDDIYLDLPLSDLASLEICVWDGGIDLVLPTPSDQVVRDRDGKEITRL
jgi:hypothetical protein